MKAPMYFGIAVGVAWAALIQALDTDNLWALSVGAFIIWIIVEILVRK